MSPGVRSIRPCSLRACPCPELFPVLVEAGLKVEIGLVDPGLVVRVLHLRGLVVLVLVLDGAAAMLAGAVGPADPVRDWTHWVASVQSRVAVIESPQRIVRSALVMLDECAGRSA